MLKIFSVSIELALAKKMDLRETLNQHNPIYPDPKPQKSGPTQNRKIDQT